MKELTRFKIGEQIPTSAKFICTESQDGENSFVYEVAIKSGETKKNKEDKIAESEIIERVINYLNNKTGSHYKPSSAVAMKCMRACIKNGASPDNFKTVIDNMCRAWGDSEMAQYLRPSTLFGGKFDEYLNLKGEDNDINDPFAGINALNKKVISDEEGNVQE